MLLKRVHLYDYVLRKLIKSDIIVDAAFQYDRPINMEKSVAFSKAEGIFVNKSVAKDRYHQVLDEIAKELETVVDQNGNKVVMKVHRREEVMSGQYIDRAPDILFTLNDGYCPTYYSDGPNSHYIGDDKGGYKGGTANTGIHRPEGIFMSYGPDITTRRLTVARTVWDIAPTILHMLNVSIPSYMDGVVMKEIFNDSSTIAAREVKKTGYEAARIKSKLSSLKKGM
jgi:predicted AlkP superfamily phosphohydrolase/phosphomutase